MLNVDIDAILLQVKLTWTNNLWVFFGYSPYFIWFLEKNKGGGFSLQYSLHKWKTSEPAVLTYTGYIHQHAQTWSDDYKAVYFVLSLCYLTQEK